MNLRQVLVVLGKDRCLREHMACIASKQVLHLDSTRCACKNRRAKTPWFGDHPGIVCFPRKSDQCWRPSQWLSDNFSYYTVAIPKYAELFMIECFLYISTAKYSKLVPVQCGQMTDLGQRWKTIRKKYTVTLGDRSLSSWYWWELCSSYEVATPQPNTG